MAVEKNADAREEAAKERQTGAELIDEEGFGLQRLELGGKVYLQD